MKLRIVSILILTVVTSMSVGQVPESKPILCNYSTLTIGQVGQINDPRNESAAAINSLVRFLRESGMSDMEICTLPAYSKLRVNYLHLEDFISNTKYLSRE